MRKIFNQKQNFDKLLNEFFQVEKNMKGLPALSGLEKAKFDTGIAIDHLYYSSKLEGTTLSEKAIHKAIYAEGFQAA